MNLVHEERRKLREAQCRSYDVTASKRERERGQEETEADQMDVVPFSQINLLVD